jgi:glycerol-3-phosphate acyltransferase PlsY
MWDEAVLVLGSYLLGSVPFMYVMGRIKGMDLTERDDSHIALWREVGRVEGFVGVLLDFTKGFTVVLVARIGVGFDPGWVAFAGVAAVCGQMWPVFLKFDGEKGNSIGLAMAGALATGAMLIGVIPMAAGLLVRTIPRFRRKGQTMDEKLRFGGPPSNSLPVGMAIGFATMPVAAWGLGHDWGIVVGLTGLFCVIMARRVTAGVTEDLREPSGRGKMLVNRLLYDRSRL